MRKVINKYIVFEIQFETSLGLAIGFENNILTRKLGLLFLCFWVELSWIRKEYR